MTARNSRNVFDEEGDTWWEDGGALVGLDALLGPFQEPYIDRALDELGTPRLRVLDLGAGGGRLTAQLAGRGHALVAADPSTRSLRAARRHTGEDLVSFVAAVGERLPFHDKSFDAVLCMDVLEHVEEPAAVVEEAARVLRPGGVFIFSGPQRTFFSKLALVTIAQNLLAIVPRGTHQAHRLIAPAEMNDLMRAAEIDPIEVLGAGVAPGNIPAAMAAVAALTLRRTTHQAAGASIRLSQGSRPSLVYIGSGRISVGSER